MGDSLGSDSVPIDKSRVLDIKPLRCLVPIFPTPAGSSQSTPFAFVPPTGPFPPGAAQFFPFHAPSEPQRPVYEPNYERSYAIPIPSPVPLNSFRTPTPVPVPVPVPAPSPEANNGPTRGRPRGSNNHVVYEEVNNNNNNNNNNIQVDGYENGFTIDTEDSGELV
ncbi:hypothetical protein Tco_0337620, partial [Tanacetum coccineum]